MYLVLVGGGQTGSKLAKRLADRGHNVVIIEKDEKRAHELAAELDVLVIHGSGADLDVLKDAGIEKADVLLALTQADEVNLMACELAKKLGVTRVIARVNDEKYARMFEEMGVDIAISLPSAAVMLFEKAVTGSGVYGLLGIGGGKGEVVEVTVGPKSKAVGKEIKDINVSKGCTLAMITRGDELIPPRGDTVIQAGDLVTVVGKPDAVLKVTKFLRGS
ncbi:MAG: NAD-binding protein [Candidatus Hodarchaeaceae archaeon]|nr:NAD-binding protein [Candidatus Hodarchaeaceae archaeon]